MTDPRPDAVGPLTAATPSRSPGSPPNPVENPVGSPAPRWAEALARNAEALARPLEVARAGGVDDRHLAAGLRSAGAGFERFLDRQPAVADSAAHTDEWALAWARKVVRLVTSHRFGEGSLAQWVLAWVAPLVPVDRGCPPPAIDDLVESATRLHGHVDLTVWARGIESAVQAWSAGEPLNRLRLRQIGAVSAWRGGFVRLRGAARAAAFALPSEVAAAVLVLPGDQVAVRTALRQNENQPGRWPGLPRSPRSVGAFRGFGGEWRLPPLVLGGDGHRWAVRSGSEPFTVLTDAFGTAVLAAPNVSGTVDAVRVEPPTRQPWWADHGHDVTAAVRAAGLVLVSHAYSHRLTLVPHDEAGSTPEPRMP